jgi:hypothetical protein
MSAEGPSISGEYLKSVLGYRELQVLHFLYNGVGDGNDLPSNAAMCEILGLGEESEISHIIRRLERKGILAIIRNGRGARSNTARKLSLSQRDNPTTRGQ